MNCKPGDIAMITAPINYGRLVEVVRWLGAHGRNTDWWVVRSLQTLRVTGGLHAGRDDGPGALGICRDAHLKPFQPPPEEDTTETEKELETT